MLTNNEQINEFKVHIKDIKKNLKKLYKEEETRPNAARQSIIAINEKQLKEHIDMLDQLKFRSKVEEKTGVDFNEWWTWAKSLYKFGPTLSGTMRVQSFALEWKEPMVWEFDSEYDCQKKVWQLCGYKIYDRKRGRGDMAEDLGAANA